MLQRHDVSDAEWELRVDADGPTPLTRQAAKLLPDVVPATVPGAVHADLLRAGLIPDPNLDANELEVAWVGHTDWVLRRRIAGSEPDDNGAGTAERTDLVFDGIDTVSRIELDGVEIGTTRNMHRAYRFDVTDALAAGDHELAVHFTSAYTEARYWEERLGTRPNSYAPEPFNFLRKMACSFGWDWGLTLVTAGLWRPVRLERWSTARIATLRPLVDYDDGVGTLSLHLDLERTENGRARELQAIVSVAGVEHVVTIRGDQDTVDAVIEVSAATPWNPRGYGAPHLYDLDVELRDGDRTLDSAHRRIGFRRVELDRSADDDGTRFTFRINGTPIFVKGVNWIPDSVLPGTVTRHDEERRVRQAFDANVNLIRVWGGGIYESDSFYDRCDELGILTWQDFLFSCAAYPEEEPLRSEVFAEARDNVTRLASHPSLVLWNGTNENLWLHEENRWDEQEGGTRTWGERYYLEWLQDIVTELDPSRPYSAGSPWSGSWEAFPNDPRHQTMHSWDVWNKDDYLDYRLTTPRFMAEFGWQAPPAWRTLRDSVSDNPLTPTSPGVLHHQKAEDGNGKLARGIERHYPRPTSLDAWHYLAQLTQVDAVTTGLSHWRSHWPHTAGAIVWQLNDLWPVTSWSAIDGAGRLKPLYFAMRNAFAPRTLSIEPGPDGPVLAIVNDTEDEWSGEVTVQRLTGDGAVLAVQEMSVSVAARAVDRVPITPAVAEYRHPDREFLVAQLDGVRALVFGADPKDSSLSEQPPLIDVDAVAGGLDITVTARSVTRGILVQADRIHPDATVDRGFETLLPGESVVYAVRCESALSPAHARADYAVMHLAAVLDESNAS